ncbi:hypothetical protein NL676_009110 [Syzygium grande]|nr:hypothetical protein NL676_009110 [Syzygium grande]
MYGVQEWPGAGRVLIARRATTTAASFIYLLGNSSGDFMVAMMPGLARMELVEKIILADHFVMICKFIRGI